MKIDEKHIYSKLLPIVTGVIFISTLIMGYTITLKSAYDTTMCVTAISVSGAIFGSSLKWYSNKQSRENALVMRLKQLESTTKLRLWFNKQMIKLMKENNLTENDLAKIDEMGEIDEAMGAAFDSTSNVVEAEQADAEAKDEVESFSM